MTKMRGHSTLCSLLPTVRRAASSWPTHSPPPILGISLFRRFPLPSQFRRWHSRRVMHFLLWRQIRRRHLLPSHSPHSLRRLRLRQPHCGRRQEGCEGQGPQAKAASSSSSSSPHGRRSHHGDCRGNTESVFRRRCCFFCFGCHGNLQICRRAAPAAVCGAMILSVGGACPRRGVFMSKRTLLSMDVSSIRTNELSLSPPTSLQRRGDSVRVETCVTSQKDNGTNGILPIFYSV